MFYEKANLVIHILFFENNFHFTFKDEKLHREMVEWQNIHFKFAVLECLGSQDIRGKFIQYRESSIGTVIRFKDCKLFLVILKA